LLEAWIGVAKAIGFTFIDVYAPGKKDVKAMLFATTERDARKYWRVNPFKKTTKGRKEEEQT
jgi:hypothetical protein